METRVIKIINNKTQSQATINSSAKTLGELKAEMDAQNIDYDGMTFYCGEMRAELKDDSAPLPETVNWKGEVKTSLTFLFTQPEKKVASGAMTRAEAYAAIKKLSLQDVCKETYGKNYTQCLTSDLEALVVKHTSEGPATAPQKYLSDKATCPELENIAKAVKILSDACYDEDIVSCEEHNKINKLLNITDCSDKAPRKNDDMSQDDIDDMFGGWAK